LKFNSIAKAFVIYIAENSFLGKSRKLSKVKTGDTPLQQKIHVKKEILN
jgi:hypothetical protein